MIVAWVERYVKSFLSSELSCYKQRKGKLKCKVILIDTPVRLEYPAGIDL